MCKICDPTTRCNIYQLPKPDKHKAVYLKIKLNEMKEKKMKLKKNSKQNLQLSKESTDILEHFSNTAFRGLLNKSQAYYLTNNLSSVLFKQNFLGTFCFHQCLALFMNFLTRKAPLNSELVFLT